MGNRGPRHARGWIQRNYHCLLVHNIITIISISISIMTMMMMTIIIILIIIIISRARG